MSKETIEYTADPNTFLDNVAALSQLVKEDRVDLFYVEGAATTVGEPILSKIYADILKRSDEVKALQPGKWLRPKRPTEAREVPNAEERTYSVKREDDGTFKIYAEHKSKYADNSLMKINWPSGSYAKWKGAIEISTPSFKPTASSVGHYDTSKPMDASALQKMEKAVMLNNLLAKEFPDSFIPISVIKEVDKDNPKKIHYRRFVEHAPFTLFSAIVSGVLNNDYSGPDYPNIDRSLVKIGKGEIEKCKLDLMWQMLKAIQDMHSVQLVHRDLKPENMLLYFDSSNNSLNLKLIDHDFTKKFPYHAEPNADHIGTPEYIATDAFVSHVQQIAPDLNINDVISYINYRISEITAKQNSDLAKQDWVYSTIIGLDIARAIAFKGLQNIDDPLFKNVFATKPDVVRGEQDVFSAGVNLYIILKSGHPSLLKNVNGKEMRADGEDAIKLLHRFFGYELQQNDLTKLIGSMLDPDLRNRINIDEALTSLEKIYADAKIALPQTALAGSENFTRQVELPEKLSDFMEAIRDFTKYYKDDAMELDQINLNLAEAVENVTSSLADIKVTPDLADDHFNTIYLDSIKFLDEIQKKLKRETSVIIDFPKFLAAYNLEIDKYLETKNIGRSTRRDEGEWVKFKFVELCRVVVDGIVVLTLNNNKIPGSADLSKACLNIERKCNKLAAAVCAFNQKPYENRFKT